MSEAETILEADRLRVVFFRRGDRYAHRLEVRDAATGGWRESLESLEGEPGDEWPPSPPFQQLHVERRASGPVVLLIGMAGKTHWSAAVEVAADRKCIRFDVAARVQVSPLQLGSEYAASAVGSAAAVGDRARIQSTLTLVQDARRIEPAGERRAPATIAWNYAILAE